MSIRWELILTVLLTGGAGIALFSLREFIMGKRADRRAFLLRLYSRLAREKEELERASDGFLSVRDRRELDALREKIVKLESEEHACHDARRGS